METIGLPELLVIGLVALVLFGSKKVPEMGKGLGEAIKGFKAALKGPEPEKPPETVDEEQPARKF